MLKVVGASWLQTRISSYILVAVGLLGIGAFVLGEFGRIENDRTYSATVLWNHKGGYRIDFWGQGNDLTALPMGAARAYYKTRIHETGWSTLEIETSPTYPDAVQAHAAGFLEGSLTWQLIHHHWYNTIGTVCSTSKNADRCERIRQSLRENTAVMRQRINLLADEDSFWHMVRLFYAQLDGMEAGWRFAVRRSRRSVKIDGADFLWLAMGSDLPEKFVTDFNSKSGESSGTASDDGGVIFVKSFDRTAEGLDPILAFAQNTVAPYSKMLRLLKRYTFGYHVSANKNAPRTPARSIFMSSYPGAVSSHDEYYVARGGNENEDMTIFAGIPLGDSPEPNLRSTNDSKDPDDNEVIDNMTQSVLSPVRIMAASRLSLEPSTWSRLLDRGNPRGTRRFQWVAVRPKDFNVWLIEQHPSTTHAIDYTATFRDDGFVFCDGRYIIKSKRDKNFTANEDSMAKDRRTSDANLNNFFVNNITSIEAIRELMRGTSRYVDDEETEQPDDASSSSTTTTSPKSVKIVESHVDHVFDPLGKFVFRGDLENPPRPIGVIDTKIAISRTDGLESFEATSGPPFGHEIKTGRPTTFFDWTQNFPNNSHIGQPEKFVFNSVVPQWVWL